MIDRVLKESTKLHQELCDAVIIIAHGLSTVKHCSMVYLMGGGRLIDRGPFSMIAERNPDFVNPQFVTSVRDR